MFLIFVSNTPLNGYILFQLAKRLEQAFELCQNDVVADTGKQDFVSVTLDTATVANTSKHYVILMVHYFGKNFSHKTLPHN